MDYGVGATLRRARERRRIDLAEVEASTKIRVRFLRALENEEWDALPGEAYARAFIRTYADYLGLDGARLAEEGRRDVAGERTGERLPQVDPAPIAAAPIPRRGRRVPPRLAALAISAGLVAVLVVFGLSSGDEGPPGAPHHQRHHKTQRQVETGLARSSEPPRGLSLSLTADAEVWVCLLDAAGQPLVDGQILPTGSEAGPFRSGSFTVSFGNGSVSMTVNGQQASIPASASPIGYTIGAGGELRELSEGERPTCT